MSSCHAFSRCDEEELLPLLAAAASASSSLTTFIEQVDDIYQLYRNVIRTIPAIVLSTEPFQYLTQLNEALVEYNMSYKKFCNNITPKTHRITHNDELIKYYGNLQRYATGRMERNHTASSHQQESNKNSQLFFSELLFQ
ncbi:hypothetical protein BLOT_012433 [Blomia tropicalis]|nr:hypothetical protein BLOT_012433 [Blomia tropicalis]